MILKGNLSTKLTLIAGSAIGVTVLAFVGVAGWAAAERTNAEILQLAAEKAAGTTAQTSIQIVDAISASRALAATMSGQLSGGAVRKTDAVAAAKSLIQDYPAIFGAWMSDTTDKRAAKSLTGSGFENEAGLFTRTGPARTTAPSISGPSRSSPRRNGTPARSRPAGASSSSPT